MRKSGTNRSIALAGLVCIAGALASCARQEYRTIECAPQPPAAGSAIAWETIAGTGGTVSLRIRALAGRDSLVVRGSSARLDSLPWRGLGPDSMVRFDSLPPGTYTLSVRSVAYRLAHAQIVVRADSGVRALAIMAFEPITFDGPCGLLVPR